MLTSPNRQERRLAPDNRNYYAAQRTLLAAERTLLAWNRTSLALMGFGFVIERFGLYVFAQVMGGLSPVERISSFLLGLLFILLGIAVAGISIFQYRSILRSLAMEEIPAGYSPKAVVLTSYLLALFGVALMTFLLISFRVTA